LTKIFEKEAVWAIISTMLDDVGPTMLDPFKQGLRLAEWFANSLYHFDHVF
jgi:hypothetical protein